ncbi:hypothetical protein N7539_009017 [Penicillium diatomitis]|uniref:Altered inheritance of mitochondria protein 6 n=1 Tax=Penicillium diatomitis TaxID=2819901 RepID=A0A9W9WKX2_9EURO|nr:uncharacterized protein N7539_009017 [Penicillium diatomitis]KAJ5469399.1 hypothetical protein N7539_009017 [Penicillium diatomitis]
MGVVGGLEMVQVRLDETDTPDSPTSHAQSMEERDEAAHLLQEYGFDHDQDFDAESEVGGHGFSDTGAHEKIQTRKTRRESIIYRLSPWRCARRRCEANGCTKHSSFRRRWRRPFWIVVAVLTILCLSSFAWDRILATLADSRDVDLFTDQLIQGVVPIACHSHNDYWRHVPLFSALAVGCTGVEADIWPDGKNLRVGHTRRTVIKNQTLRSLYLDPILNILDQHNPANNVSSKDTASIIQQETFAPVGVFLTEPSQPLILLIDFKIEPETLWPILMADLEPLRQKGYLTHFNGSNIVHRPLTIVATGDAPFDRIQGNSTYRDIFYDAPLDKLSPRPSSTSSSTNTSISPYNQYNSYYASVSFRHSIGSLYLGRLSNDQLTKVQSQIATAHARGLKVRYWGTPGWPAALRNYVWRVLEREGVDMLNVDDLRAASRGTWREESWWWGW